MTGMYSTQQQGDSFTVHWSHD